MAIKAHIDTIEDIELNERYGSLNGLKRRMVVTGMTGSTYATVYQALDAAGVPAKESYLTGHTHLIVTDRSVKMLDQDKAEVIITYGPFNDKGQRLFSAGVVVGRNIAGRMAASVTQKETNLYKEAGVGPKTLIQVQHTYPSTDPDYANKTVVQNGLVKVSLPQRTFTIEGVKELVAPWEMAERLIGAINANIWLAQAPWTWMCTEVTWEYIEYGKYFMTFQFQHDEDTWNPTSVFQDERTKQPPVGLIEGEGFKQIRYHREVSFVQELGFYVIGPAQG